MTDINADEPLLQATEALARMWNRLDPSLLEPLLAENVRYDCSETGMILEGKAEVLDYLRRKVDLIEVVGEGARIRAQTGFVTTVAERKRPCVISSQGEVEPAALFMVTLGRDGLVHRVEVCTEDPDPRTAEGTDSFPA